MNLEAIGWNSVLEMQFREYAESGYRPARINREDRQQYRMLAADGELSGRVSGRFMHHAKDSTEFPAVGDWIAYKRQEGNETCLIYAVLPRKSALIREIPDRATEAQVVAANVETVFIVCGLDGGRAFNIRRIERYLTLAWESGGSPVVVLNKVDLCEDIDSRMSEAASIAQQVPVHPVSAINKTGIDALRVYLGPGRTAIFLGSSGVGKSELINALSGGERVLTGEVRESDKRGRHTTTWREMIVLPEGGVIIDTPGMRELRVWGDEDSLADSFSDIEDLKSACRFRDCQHAAEPGCAVHEALRQGLLAQDRYDSYLKLQAEIESLARRQTQKSRNNSKAGMKNISLMIREINKSNGGK